MILNRGITGIKYNDKATPVTENIPLGEQNELDQDDLIEEPQFDAKQLDYNFRSPE